MNSVEQTFQTLKYGIPTPLTVCDWVNEYLDNRVFPLYHSEWEYQNNLYCKETHFFKIYVHYNGTSTICSIDYINDPALAHLQCKCQIYCGDKDKLEFIDYFADIYEEFSDLARSIEHRLNFPD